MSVAISSARRLSSDRTRRPSKGMPQLYVWHIGSTRADKLPSYG
jgi:hypothetical protein